MLKISCCWGCAQLGSTQDHKDSIAGSAPSLGLGSGLDSTVWIPVGDFRCNKSSSATTIRTQRILETALKKWWSLSSIQHWDDPCLWRTFTLWHAHTDCLKSIYSGSILVHQDVKQFRGGMQSIHGKPGQNLMWMWSCLDDQSLSGSP